MVELKTFKNGTQSARINYDIFNFSGSQGYVYDQSGRFFGGYRSGQSINITTHYDYSNDKFKYYFKNA